MFTKDQLNKKITIRGYNGKPCFMQTHSAKDGAAWLKKSGFIQSKEHARQLKSQYESAFSFAVKHYSSELNNAFLQQFGRLPMPADYKISAVWRDEFPSYTKDLLRRLAHEKTEYKTMMAALDHLIKFYRFA